MKWLLSLVTIGCLVALLSAAPFTFPKFGDSTYLKQQSDVLLVLKYIHQPFWNAELYKYGADYHLETDLANYNNVHEVKEFVTLFNKKRLLPRGAIFNLYDQGHLEQVQALFNVFYNAKDYDTMWKFATWARAVVNENLFMYVFGVYLAHKPELKTLVMPPPYEVCPYKYIPAEAIKMAQRHKMQGFYGIEKVSGLKEVIVPVNYSGWQMHLNMDQKVSYFTEDVGLNAFYYNFNIDYPHWMEGKPYGIDLDRRGEMYLAFHHEMYARYYLERLSNDLGHVPTFNWREPFAAGYYPQLMYVNGKQVKTRSNNYNLWTEGNHKFIQEAEDRERRIRDVIDLGFITYGDKTVSLSKPEDVNTLGNLLQGNPDGFGLHHNFHDHIVISDYMENYATAARDPIFYSFYKNLMANFWKFMSHLKPYTVEEIGFPGVEITDIQVDKIQTFFEDFDVDITNAIEVEVDPNTHSDDKVNEVHFKPDEYLVKARTVRINHKPFNIKIEVKSNAKYDAAFRMYLGPKYDEFGTVISFEENRKNFVLLDLFKESLNSGVNVITRNSESQYMYYGKPQTSYYELYKLVMQAKKGEIEWPKLLNGPHCQYPKNLMIPKGKVGGMTYQLYVVVNPYVAPKVPIGSTFDMFTSCGVGSGARFFEDRPMLFPLDREIDPAYFYVPNMHFEDVEIFFKADEHFARFF